MSPRMTIPFGVLEMAASENAISGSLTELSEIGNGDFSLTEARAVEQERSFAGPQFRPRDRFGTRSI